MKPGPIGVTREQRRGTLAHVIILEGIAATLALAAIIDILFQKGWGFDWGDVLMIVGVGVGAACVFALMRHLPNLPDQE